jgi:hypothetical protein
VSSDPIYNTFRVVLSKVVLIPKVVLIGLVVVVEVSKRRGVEGIPKVKHEVEPDQVVVRRAKMW